MGSNEIITDEASLPHEFHLTLPFGETMVEQRKPMSDYYNSWKFTGKELDRETGLYYFGARYYQPSWSIWLSVDPLLEKVSHLTPYHYVSNNPINRIDPDGLTDYQLLQDGSIERIGEINDDPDVLYATDNDGNIDWDNSIELEEKGIIDSRRPQSVETNRGPMDVDIYTINGDDLARKIFEFVAKYSKVEWSITGVGNADTNMLTTSGKKRKEAGGPLLLSQGYKFRYNDHNHPNSSSASGGNKSFAGRVHSAFPNENVRLRIYFEGDYFHYNSKGNIKPVNELQPMGIVKF